MKDLRIPGRCLVLALTLTIFCTVVSARQHLPNGLVLDKPSVDLGTLVIGNSTFVTETIFNPTNSSISIAAVSVDNPAFQISGINSPLVIGAGRQVTVGITFVPAAVGQISGSLTLSLDGNTPYVTIPLNGVAVALGQLSASPSTITLGTAWPIDRRNTYKFRRNPRNHYFGDCQRKWIRPYRAAISNIAADESKHNF